ncbi:MAG: thiamine diphosphokinase [Actinomycetia bacterium]|nr:thiamine diphosphokinase [Actinomycetes bacterium]
MDRPVVVLVGGGDPHPSVADLLPADPFVIAADSGLHWAERLGLGVDLLVGDLDSADPIIVEHWEQKGATVERHPEVKDATDLELALDRAVAHGARRVAVVGGYGGDDRLDHFTANLGLLASPAYASTDLVAHMGPATVTVVRREVRLHGRPGELLSLVPFHGPVTGVTTTGLLYPLAGAELGPGSTRGVSNELADPVATVTVTGGVLVAVSPGQDGTHVKRGLGPQGEQQ